MSFFPFIVVSLTATALALLFRRRPAVTATVGLVGLVGALLAALAIRPDETIFVGGAPIATTEFLRLFLVLGTSSGLVLALMGVAAGSRRDAPAVILGTLGLTGLALSLPDPGIAVLAVTAAGLLGVLVTLVPTGGRAGASVGIREVRAVVIAGTLAIAAAAWIGRPLGDLAAQPVVFGLTYLAVVLAVAIRFGAIPFHMWAARLADVAPEVMLPVLLGWAPAAFAIVTLTWIDTSVAPLLLDLSLERNIVIAIAVASIVLATLAAWLQDDLEHIVGYSIVGDAGVAILALATLDTEAWAPARTWILTFVVARSAFAVWAAAIRATFWTGRVDDLRGWALRAPLLGVAFGLIVVAGVGFPGLAAFEARSAIIGIALGGPIETAILIAAVAPILYYTRLFIVGVSRPDRPRSRESSWRPEGRRLDLTAFRSWSIEVGRLNRAPIAAVLAVAIGMLSLGISAGAFGVSEAAAGLAPGFGVTGP